MTIHIAFCGAHRVGKSTTAKAFADATGIPFLEIKSSSVAQRLGINVAVPQPPAQRLKLQTELLKMFREKMSVPNNWVADRSPLDLLIYMMLEYPDAELTLQNYALSCVDLLFETVTHLIYIPPALPIVADEKSASADPSVILKADVLIRGILSRYVEDRDYDGEGRLRLRLFRLDSRTTTLAHRVAHCRTFTQQFGVAHGNKT